MKRSWRKRCAAAGLGMLACWCVSQLLYMATCQPRAGRALLIAHRGGPALGPENTLATFRQSGELDGVDVLETDVRQSQDGVLVLMHDASVGRTTDGRGAVEQLSSAELARLRAGGEAVPTFAQFVELARSSSMDILPEVKGRTPGIEEAMVTVLEDLQMLDRAHVQSFSAASLERLHRLRPNLKLCRTFYPWRLWVGKNPDGVSVVSPMAEALLLNPWMVRHAHSQGLQVWPWFAGLESDLTVHWILSMGVDGLMVNDPRRPWQ